MQTITLPGLIDPHVHLRDPQQTHKEDFYTGTSAALAGGYTTIIDMPNNKTPITTLERLEEKIQIAKKKIVCDVGFYFGSLGDNLEEFKKIRGKVFGLKLYLNETTGNFLIDKEKLEQIFITWSQSLSLHSNRLYAPKPILLHAEDAAVEYVIKLVNKLKTRVHFCHISTASDLKQIIKAKEKGLPITCGVTPHHLFLNKHDAETLGPYGKMKPPLCPQKDVDFLWKHLQAIDVVESDHAPHTIEEKTGVSSKQTRQLIHARGGTKIFSVRISSSLVKFTNNYELRNKKIFSTDLSAHQAPHGVPGVETTLPLLLTQVSKNKLTIDDVVRLCFESPKKIFNISTHPQTKIEVDVRKSYIINRKSLHTKCGWSPFDGWKVKGKVQRVFIRGKKVFENDIILAQPGSGEIITR